MIMPNIGDNAPLSYIPSERQSYIKMPEPPTEITEPTWYNDGGIQTWDFIEAKNLNFNLGNVVKYISRAGKKHDNDYVADLMKARQYLQREIDKYGDV
jgi:hypothetical protein